MNAESKIESGGPERSYIVELGMHLLSVVVCACTLFVASYIAAFLSWMGWQFLGKGEAFFTQPVQGWGTKETWQEHCGKFALYAQLFAFPGLLTYFFWTAHLWRSGRKGFGIYLLSAFVLASINGIVFLPFLDGHITILFMAAGVMTGIFYYFLSVFIPSILAGFVRACFQLCARRG